MVVTDRPAAAPSSSPSPTKRRGLRVATLVAAALLPWTWFWPRDRFVAADLVALATPLLIVPVMIVVVVSLVRRGAVLAIVSVSVLAMFTATVVAPWWPRSTPPPAVPLRFVSVNANMYTTSSEAKAAAILHGSPDVVGVVEARTDLLDALRSTLPNVATSRTLMSFGGEAILSRWPVRQVLLPRPVPADFAGVLAVVDSPAGQIAVLAVHLRRAVIDITAERQRATIEWAAEVLATTGLPAVLLGDLNMSDRQTPYRWLTDRFRDAGRADAAGPTFFGSRAEVFLFRIDYVFIPRSWCADDARSFGVPGSDHRGVRVTVGPCRAGAAATAGPPAATK